MPCASASMVRRLSRRMLYLHEMQEGEVDGLAMTEEARNIVGKLRCAETEIKEVGMTYFGDDDCGKAADLIESLSAQLDQVTMERDGLQMELDELKEEYYTGIHTARDPMADKVKQLERERDAAVKDLKDELKKHSIVSMCEHCMYEPADDYIPNDCMDCVNSCNWQWRGAQEV